MHGQAKTINHVEIPSLLSGFDTKRKEEPLKCKTTTTKSSWVFLATFTTPQPLSSEMGK